MCNNIEIIIGTYEEFLLGYHLSEENMSLTQSFADRSHTGAVKCVAVGRNYIASGGTDDRIFVYDMKKRKQNQILLNHEGTVNTVAFSPDITHLFSGGDDGRMLAVNLSNWSIEGSWKKAHDGSVVTHISCHPSGKLALTLGRDRTLRTWNLVKGRIGYKTNLRSRTTLGQFPDCLTWSLNGEYFTMTGPRVIEIWSIKKADVWKSEITSSKPICIVWANDSHILAGLENGKILLLSINQDDKAISFDAHKSRVKALCTHNDLLISVCSSGDIKIWKMNFLEKTIKEIVSTNIGCRPTCMGILELNQFGPDYILNKTSNEKLEKICQTNVDSSKQQQKRGVVMIEYENKKNGDEANSSEKNAYEDTDTSDDSSSAEDYELPTNNKKRKSSTHSNLNRTKSTKENIKLKKTSQPGTFVRLYKKC